MKEYEEELLEKAKELESQRPFDNLGQLVEYFEHQGKMREEGDVFEGEPDKWMINREGLGLFIEAGIVPAKLFFKKGHLHIVFHHRSLKFFVPITKWECWCKIRDGWDE